MKSGRERTLILVDDDADDILLAERSARQMWPEARVIAERDPRRVVGMLEGLRTSGADLSRCIVLLDIRMPHLDGFRLMLDIRSHPDIWRVPAVMLSASEEEKDVGQSFFVGSDDYISKPLCADTLRRSVGRLEPIVRQRFGRPEASAHQAP